MIVDCALYTDGHRHPGTLHIDDALEACRSGEDTFVWIGLHEPTQDEFDQVTSEFELHPLAVEDAIEAHQVLNVNLTHVSVQQNEDMRRISGWVAIAAVPTMPAGLWGMNFENMPELDEWCGYPLALLIMAGSAFFLFRWLRSRLWI